MNDANYLSTRYGSLQYVEVYTYRVENKVFKNKEKYNRLKEYLTRYSRKILLKTEGQHFTTFYPCDDSFQYILVSTQQITPPFSTEMMLPIQTYINAEVHAQINEAYPQFLDENTYIHHEVVHQEVKVVKCIKFNVALFNDGKFLVHFFPNSKLTYAGDDMLGHLRKIHYLLKDIREGTHLHIVSIDRYKKHKVTFNQTTQLKHAENLITNERAHLLIYNVEILSNAFPSLWKTVFFTMQNDINKSINHCLEVSSKLTSSLNVAYRNLPLMPVQNYNALNYANLLVGKQKQVKSLSAIYHNGMLHPMPTRTFVCIDHLGKHIKNMNFFRDVIDSQFNQGVTCNYFRHISDPAIPLDSALQTYLASHKATTKNVVVVFTTGMLSKEYIDFLKSLNTPFHISNSVFNQYQLSNFAFACLRKHGGVPALLSLPPSLKHTVFVGIDLGHNPSYIDRSKSYTNLSVSFISHQGKVLKKITLKNLPLNETITIASLTDVITQFKMYSNNVGLNIHTFIIHRDGKCHAQDTSNILSVFKTYFPDQKIEIVEVIKSGFPAYVSSTKSSFKNMTSGQFWHAQTQDYGILITADQESAKNQLTNPLVIRKICGTTSIHDLICQVYWLAKINIKNLYNVSRLPLTTQTANDAAITKSRGR